MRVETIGPIPSRTDIERLVAVEHTSPHSVLGAHPARAKTFTGFVVRAFDPDAVGIEVLLDDVPPIAMTRIHDAGLFQADVAGDPEIRPYRLRFRYANGEQTVDDPYRFLPTLGDVDLYLSGEGSHRRIHDKLGAHVREEGGVRGVSFSVWAPSAVRVSVIGDWNRWDGRRHPMRALGASGIWELFLPGIGEDECYKFEVKAPGGDLLWKADPYSRRMEEPPRTASVVTGSSTYAWQDEAWMAARREGDLVRRPLAVYEVHLGSWRSGCASYRDIAVPLVQHVKDLGFTHIELMPVMEHPFRGSWGYQVTGYYASSRRWGEPDDLRHLIDACHREGIGVLLDWVPAHFPRDPHALERFDGSALYEHLDPRQGEHPDWGTLVFNFGRREVRNFLVSNALYWLDEFHLDGLRIDAVSSMLYLDYSREDGEWVPNEYGGNENLAAIEFLKELNEIVHAEYPGALMIAEESTAWGGVSRPTHLGGLGFTYKWNMGWMHDALGYFGRDPVHRKFHQDDLTFPLVYAFSENFILPLSHDEVVHGKGSLLGKMSGDAWQKAANLRAFFAYMITTPGKKLLFMGSELAPWREWDHDGTLDWGLLEHEPHRGIHRCLRDLLHLYRERPALWELDQEPDGFTWIDFHDRDASVVSWMRHGATPGDHVVVALNLTPQVREGYVLGVPSDGAYLEAVNTDSGIYGGGNVGNAGSVLAERKPEHGQPCRLRLTLPPLAAVVLVPR